MKKDRFYLIGEKLGHSFSPQIHRAFGRYDYALRELAPEELGAFLEAREFRGLNVTIPYKQAVIPWLEGLDPSAAAIGAVNTVVNRNGRLWGYNTDFGGMKAGLEALLGSQPSAFPESGGQSAVPAAGAPQARPALAGKTVLILGTGGTSRTALAVCKALGAAEALRVSRTCREGAVSYAEARRRFGGPAGPELVILNTTPVGMYPRNGELPLDPADFPALAGVYDCVYNPLRTRLVLETRGLGLPACGGLYMLVKQAALACEGFTGAPVPERQVSEILRTLEAERENTVLIGMPGAGKSTVGRILAQKTGKEFVDTDEEIVKLAGCSIPELFAARGEAAFRDLESQVIQGLARTGGRIIATGGGAVLRRENVAWLRQNGRLVFLDRPLEALLPTEDRPLGNSAEKLRQLYAARFPIYQAAADVVIQAPPTPEAAADRLARLWGGQAEEEL